MTKAATGATIGAAPSNPPLGKLSIAEMTDLLERLEAEIVEQDATPVEHSEHADRPATCLH